MMRAFTSRVLGSPGVALLASYSAAQNQRVLETQYEYTVRGRDAKTGILVYRTGVATAGTSRCESIKECEPTP